MSEAGLTEGAYVNCSGLTPLVNDHAPLLPFNKATNWAVVAECVAADCNGAAGAKGDGHWIWTHGVYNNSKYWQMRAGGFSAQWQSPFTVEDVRWFDTKVDNGHGLTGKMTFMVSYGQIPADGASSCGDSTAADGFKTGAAYLGNPRQCHLRYKTSF